MWAHEKRTHLGGPGVEAGGEEGRVEEGWREAPRRSGPGGGGGHLVLGGGHRAAQEGLERPHETLEPRGRVGVAGGRKGPRYQGLRQGLVAQKRGRAAQRGSSVRRKEARKLQGGGRDETTRANRARGKALRWPTSLFFCLQVALEGFDGTLRGIYSRGGTLGKRCQDRGQPSAWALRLGVGEKGRVGARSRGWCKG